MNDVTDYFKNRVAELRTFVTVHGRMPVQCAASDPAERALGDFLRTHRGNLNQAARRTAGAIARAGYLDEHVPGWRSENVRPVSRRSIGTDFERRVAQVARFTRKHGHLPRHSATSQTEAVLGRFLVNQRQAKKGRGTTAWSEQRGAILDARIPGWDAARTYALAA